ncbi:hypothetical protein HOP50_04g33350 [Chloropicon primus]|uniref:Uncharacterized protein n=2 Tax=Chloropicon primus TaxID=1764295 RepID=A0A5B8MLF3_9CHLO|nr:hypothetical protein A3770_04p33320 [Chloropicon primus]UPR00026.1 hypothetical protein HOP50_04g33350 [Chloropicon primus]|eukprot:QDZ20814.1 hypothetical protein A3770_04p33320 [Chloropicon primus]
MLAVLVLAALAGTAVPPIQGATPASTRTGRVADPVQPWSPVARATSRHHRQLLGITSSESSSESSTTGFALNGQSASFGTRASGEVAKDGDNAVSDSSSDATLDIVSMVGEIASDAKSVAAQPEGEASTHSRATAVTTKRADTDAIAHAKVSALPRQHHSSKSSKKKASPSKGKKAFADATGFAIAEGLGPGQTTTSISSLASLIAEEVADDGRKGFATGRAKGQTELAGMARTDDWSPLVSVSDSAIRLDAHADPAGSTDATAHVAGESFSLGHLVQQFAHSAGMADAFDTASAKDKGPSSESQSDADAAGSATGSATTITGENLAKTVVGVGAGAGAYADAGNAGGLGGGADGTSRGSGGGYAEAIAEPHQVGSGNPEAVTMKYADLYTEAGSSVDAEAIGPNMFADISVGAHQAAGGSTESSSLFGRTFVTGDTVADASALAGQGSSVGYVLMGAGSMGGVSTESGILAVSEGPPRYGASSTFVGGYADVASASSTLPPAYTAGAGTMGEAMFDLDSQASAISQWKSDAPSVSSIQGTIGASIESESGFDSSSGTAVEADSKVGGRAQSSSVEEGDETYVRHQSAGNAATNAVSSAFGDGKDAWKTGTATVGGMATEAAIDAHSGVESFAHPDDVWKAPPLLTMGQTDTTVESRSGSATSLDTDGIATGLGDAPASETYGSAGSMASEGHAYNHAVSGLMSNTWSETLVGAGAAQEGHVVPYDIHGYPYIYGDDWKVLDYPGTAFGTALGGATGLGTVVLAQESEWGTRVNGGAASDAVAAAGAEDFLAASKYGSVAVSDAGAAASGEGRGYGSTLYDGVVDAWNRGMIYARGQGNANVANAAGTEAADFTKLGVGIAGGAARGGGLAEVSAENAWYGHGGSSGAAVGAAEAENFGMSVVDDARAGEGTGDPDVSFSLQDGLGAGTGYASVAIYPTKEIQPTQPKGVVSALVKSDGFTTGLAGTSMGFFDTGDVLTHAGAFIGAASAEGSNNIVGHDPIANLEVDSVASGNAEVVLATDGTQYGRTRNFADNVGVAFTNADWGEGGETDTASSAFSMSAILHPGEYFREPGFLSIDQHNFLHANVGGSKAFGYGIGSGAGTASADERFRSIDGRARGSGIGMGTSVAGGINVDGFDLSGAVALGGGVGTGFTSATGKVNPNPYDQDGQVMTINLGAGGSSVKTVGHATGQATGGGGAGGSGDFVLGESMGLDYLGAMAHASGNGHGSAAVRVPSAVDAGVLEEVGASGYGYGNGGAEASRDESQDPVIVGSGTLYGSGAAVMITGINRDES